MAVNIQLRRGTSAQWTLANPILALAEMAIETDTDQFKIGNGVDHWNDLPYGGVQGPKGVPGYFLGLNLIGASTNIGDRPVSASNGDAWGLISGSTLTIYIWNVSQWYTAGPITSPPTYPIANTIFVATDGNDNASGDTAASAVLTLEKALTLAYARHALTLIEVGPGVYTTQGSLDVPDDTIIRCVHRAAVIKPQPGYEERNVFRVGSGCFLEGFIFEGWRVDSLTNPTVGFAVSFRPGALIRRAPYAHKIAVRSIPYWDQVAPPLDRRNGNPLVGRGGGVVLADATVCDPDSIFPNIMTWGATPVTPNGIGYCSKKGAAINAVNAVSMWSHKHFLAIDGGQIILSACSTQFGDYTMVAQGSRNIVNPYKTTATLVAQPTAAATIVANTATIISNMWSALVSNGYTAGWTINDENLTKRDANTFLQVMKWVVETGNEKPALDFAKGLFTVMGDKVFATSKQSAFIFSFNNMRDQLISVLDAAPPQYNTATITKDISLCIDAIGMDLLYGDNSNSQFIGLRGWTQTNFTSLITSNLTATVASINYLRDLSIGFVDSALTGTVTQLYSTLTSILNSGTSVVTNWLNFGTFPSSTASWLTSYSNLQSNKAGMQNAVITFLNTNYPGVVYTTATCIRDVGYIIDSVGFDLLNMSNAQSIKMAVYGYAYSDTTSTFGNTKGITVAGFDYIKTLTPFVVTGSTVTNILQTGTAQVITASTGTVLDSAALNTDLTLINNIINNGQDVAGSLKAMSGVYTVSTATKNAYTLLQSNKSFITAEVLAFINGLDNAMITDLVAKLNQTITNTIFQKEPSLITAIGHTWSSVMAGVALTKIPPARNLAAIQDSILEINEGNVIASGQDDAGNAIFVGGLEINADTGELSGPPFVNSVNQIATRASITRSF